MRGNVVVGQSGGPTAVINASVAGVYAAAHSLGANKIYGMIHGIEGFLEGKVVDLASYLDEEDGIEILKRTPSAFLGSCRFKMPKETDDEAVYQKIFEVMEAYEIAYFFYIGGNDSMDTVKMLSDYAKAHGKTQRFIGIPKTIDNDLPITDHCPGYGSVAKYIATSVKETIRDNESFGLKKPTVCIVETMGRNAGWITAAAALCKGDDCSGPDAIYIPERALDVDDFVKEVERLAAQKTSVVIVVSEGTKLPDGRYVSELAADYAKKDAFGHIQNVGTAFYLAGEVTKKTGIKTRPIVLSSAQRAATHLASLTDIDEAFMAGEAAVRAAVNEESGKMVIFKRNDSKGYMCETDLYDIHEIANVEKMIPDAWIGEDGHNVTDDFINYARPLIMGELTPMYRDGLPRHLVLKES